MYGITKINDHSLRSFINLIPLSFISLPYIVISSRNQSGKMLRCDIKVGPGIVTVRLLYIIFSTLMAVITVTFYEMNKISLVNN